MKTDAGLWIAYYARAELARLESDVLIEWSIHNRGTCYEPECEFSH
jgi:hypothetical protein